MTTGILYRWTYGIGTINGVLDALETTSKVVTCVATRPVGPSNLNRVAVIILRNGVQLSESGAVKDFTLLANVTPAQPGSITLQANSPTFGGVCQFTSGTLSVPAVSGAYQYEWTFGGSSATTFGPSLSVSFNTTGTITATVRARGCAGASATTSTSYGVIPSGQGPCAGTFAAALEVAPNPASTDFTLKTTEDYVSSSARLTDSQTGKVAKTFTVTATTMKVDVSDVPDGTYLLTLDGKKDKVTKRVVVKK
ncbi:MAG: T9SS type A sorting domain-containing protein [Cytophagales bacterium]|nr:T9SS type A sorting domain-containing protein [Cytophagales bacterium]